MWERGNILVEQKNTQDFFKAWKHLPKEISKKEFGNIVKDFAWLQNRCKDEKNKQYFLDKLNISIQNATACKFLANMGLLIPLTVLVRTLFETMIIVYWSSLSNENCQQNIDAEKNDVLRIMKNQLREGRAEIINKETGKIDTETVLNDARVKKAKRYPPIAEMATAAKIRNVYDMFYGILGMYAHGHPYGITLEKLLLAGNEKEENKEIKAIMALMTGCLTVIHVVVANYICEGKHIEKKDIESILGIKLSE